MPEGKHYIKLVEDIQASDYDLVIMGALGMGAVKDSLIGGVTERVVRRINTDTLVVRDLAPIEEHDGNILVGIDGSPESFFRFENRYPSRTDVEQTGRSRWGLRSISPLYRLQFRCQCAYGTCSEDFQI